MDFAFSEEQEMLRSQARSFLADRFDEATVVELAGSDAGWDPASWGAIAELGWLGLSAPEASGGSGMSFLDESVLFEELGSVLYPGPYLSSIALALPAIEGDPELVGRLVGGEVSFTFAWADEGSSALLSDAGGSTSAKAVRDGDAWRLSGKKVLVPDAGLVSHILVAAKSDDGLGLWVTEAADAVVHGASTMDSTRGYGTVYDQDAGGRLVVEPSAAGPVLERIRLRVGGSRRRRCRSGAAGP